MTLCREPHEPSECIAGASIETIFLACLAYSQGVTFSCLAQADAYLQSQAMRIHSPKTRDTMLNLGQLDLIYGMPVRRLLSVCACDGNLHEQPMQ